MESHGQGCNIAPVSLTEIGYHDFKSGNCEQSPRGQLSDRLDHQFDSLVEENKFLDPNLVSSERPLLSEG